MKSRYLLIVTLFFTTFSCAVFGQEKKIKKANEKFTQFEYIDAIEIYRQVAESGYMSEEILERLGNGLFFNSKYKASSRWYDSLYVLKKGKLTPELLLRFSQSLRSSGEDEKAKRIYDEFLNSYDSKEGDFMSAKDYLEIIENNSNRYETALLKFNSRKYIDFGGTLSSDTLYFSSTRADRRSIGKVDTWTNQPFLDIYYVTKSDETEEYGKPQVLKGDVNTNLHESSVTITKDGRTMYFTRSNTTTYYDENKNEVTHLKIYRATKDKNGVWGNVIDLPINGEDFSNAHPVLGPLDRKLYFVSNRPGGKGQTDIYSVDIFKDGGMGKPRNLGSEVNTSGRESFPFISRNYELYFSSDGHFGLGGYDVFYIDLLSGDRQLINVGKPINSMKDDYAFSIDVVSRKGYFSSNRDGVDNIYSLLETKPIQDLLYTELSGTVLEKESKKPLDNATVTVRDRKNMVKHSLTTNNSGEFKVKINRYQSYTVRAEKKDYDSNDVFVKKKQENPTVELTLGLNAQKIQQGIDLAKILNIVVYFDFDKSEIREDAKAELEKMVVLLTKYNTLQIGLRAHTDSKGKDEYNLKLSRRRAIATMNYLIARGISKERLLAEGLGEKELINKCTNDVECSEEEHQANRRTEFIILEKK